MLNKILNKELKKRYRQKLTDQKEAIWMVKISKSIRLQIFNTNFWMIHKLKTWFMFKNYSKRGSVA